MKICSRYPVLPSPKRHVVTWTHTEEDCHESVYELRQRQNNQRGNWFRNLKLLRVDHLQAVGYPPGTYYDTYHIEYDRKDEYDVIDIPSSGLVQLLKDNPGMSLQYADGELWLEYVGD